MHLAEALIQSDLHCIQVTVFTFLSALAFPVSRISQAHSPPNHNALLHLSINCTHLHVISTLISLHTKAHTSHQHIVRSRFIQSGLMLLQLLTCVLTLISYLPPVSSPVCSSQLYSIVCVSKDLLECVSPVQDCEVCVLRFPHPRVPVKAKEIPLSPSSYYCACSLNLLLISISYPLTPPIAIKLTCCILTICLSLLP